MAPSSEPPLSESTQNGSSNFEMDEMNPGEEKAKFDLERADQEHSDDSADVPKSPRSVHGFAWGLIVFSTLTSMFIYSLDNTIVADLIPAIVNDFNGISLLPWLSVGFMIGGVAVVLPFGKLYGLYNAKYLYIMSAVLFLAASALCGGAPNMTAMIVGRVFAGAGGNGMFLGILTLLSVNTSDRERPAYLSLVGFFWGLGTVLGPVVGGGFQIFNWRWSFYINLIIGALFAPIYVFLLPPFDPQPKSVSLKERASGFDYTGVVLSIGAMISLILAINFGGVLYPWDSGQIIALFVISGILWIVFGVQQSFALLTSVDKRMFPTHLLRNREAVLLFLASASGYSACFLPIFYTPIYFQFTRGDDALESAVRLLPYIMVLSATILLNGFLMSKLGYYMPWYAIGSVLALIGSVLMSRIEVDTPTAQIYGYEILIGVGTGAFVQAGYATIQTAIEPVDMSYGIAQFGGITLGLSIGGAVFINCAQNALKALFPDVDDATLQQAISGTSSTFIKNLSGPLRAATLEAIVHSLRKT
ncbi:hypothetical protein MMC22_004140 [Lobaria immixta]|nr:hypothetical protein [Lobaria immixta]